jgi:hypothetical protein
MDFTHEQKRCSHRFGRDQRIYARGCGGMHLKQGHRRLSLALGNGISDLHSIAAPIFGPLRTLLTLTSSGGPAFVLERGRVVTHATAHRNNRVGHSGHELDPWVHWGAYYGPMVHAS